jgi:hypothetical protein
MIDLQVLYELLAKRIGKGTMTYGELSAQYHKRTGEWHEPHGTWDSPLGEVNRRVHLTRIIHEHDGPAVSSRAKSRDRL